jgi:hypothetical protein
MRAYQVVILNSKGKMVGTANHEMARNKEQASAQVIRRYRQHWKLGADIKLSTLVAEKAEKNPTPYFTGRKVSA